jgi:hypothetical protein
MTTELSSRPPGFACNGLARAVGAVMLSESTDPGADMLKRAIPMSLMMGLFLIGSLPAQVIVPAKPKEYDVSLRYRIRAASQQRIATFEAMAKHLKSIGFKHIDEKLFETDLLDPGAEKVTGTIASDAVGKLFDNPNIKTVLLTPVGSKPFEDPAKMVELKLDIASGFLQNEQRDLHNQIIDHLAQLGFVANTAYDHAGFTMIRGTMPAANVPLLTKDLRSLPKGWFLGDTDRTSLPTPLKNVLPLRLIEVLPDLPQARLKPNPVNAGKATADVLAILADPAKAEQPLVVEALLEIDTTNSTAASRREAAGEFSGVAVEGLAGRVATLRLSKATYVSKLNESPLVRHVRLPRTATETASTITGPVTDADFVKQSNLGLLHAMGFEGSGTKVVVVASEFNGLSVKTVRTSRSLDIQELTLAGKVLPPGSRFLDLTTEVSPGILPTPNDANRVAGTATALATHVAAPKAKLILVRVDPTRLHQVLSVAKLVTGDEISTPALYTRNEELSVRTATLEARSRVVNNEVQKAYADLSDEDAPRKRREAATAALKQFKADDAANQAVVSRYLQLREGLDVLRGSNVVVNTLTWNTGYASDGQSDLTKFINDHYTVGFQTSAIRATKVAPVPTWVQPASQAMGQVWTGAYLDADGTSVMEFLGANQILPAKRWTRELNFLQYKANSAKPTGVIPAGTHLRITVQWREAHNPDVVLTTEPVQEIQLRLFRQLDPEGKTYRSDELVEVARSVGVPVRLEATAGSGVYEQTIEFTTTVDSVLALRLENGLAPQLAAKAQRLNAEIHPRVVVELPETAQALKGVLQWETASTQNSGVGIPADSNVALTAGVAHKNEAVADATLTGVGPNLTLGVKPDLLAESRISVGNTAVGGSAVSAGHLAGLAACLKATDVRATDLIRTMGLKPGSPVVLPVEWIKSISPRRPETER